MKPILFALCITAFLGGCSWDQQEVQAVKTQFEAVVPPESLYQCPGKPARPTNPVTDKKVAEFIVKLDNAHSVCSHSLEAIRAFARQAKLSIESNQPNR